LSGGSSAELNSSYPPSPSSSGPLSPTTTPSPASPSRGARGPPSHGQDYEGRAAGVVQEAAVRRSSGMVTMAAVEGGGGVRASMADGSLLETLKRLKSNDRDLTEFKTPPTIMQELQASTLELIKIISDCLVFNTHLKVCAAFSAFALSLLSFFWSRTHFATCCAEIGSVGLRDEGGRGEAARRGASRELDPRIPQHHVVQPR
jgi:hypothetical protein